ncbi:hypothetical protein DFH11DRAFT_1644163 [Phellopilus nigrolimitatus]|nr:hypothetical protein DFH11DRAFT_1644163 [Phellopilus nigrolimitatus]
MVIMKTVNPTCLPAPTLSRQCCPRRGPTRHRLRKVHHTIIRQAILAMTRLLRPNYSLHFRGETGILRDQIKATACRQQKRHVRGRRRRERELEEQRLVFVQLLRARRLRCANQAFRIRRASTRHTLLPRLPLQFSQHPGWTHRPLVCRSSFKARAAELQQRTPRVRARRDRRGPKRQKRPLARARPGLRKRKRQEKPFV